MGRRNADTSPLLAGLAAASAQGRVVLGGMPGARPRRVGQASGAGDRDVPAPGTCHARWEGFDLHAAVRVPAGQRARLERVCRYTLRPPVAGARLQVDPDGQFAPTAFLERLAALVPRPHVNLLLYHAPRRCAVLRAAARRGPS